MEDGPQGVQDVGESPLCNKRSKRVVSLGGLWSRSDQEHEGNNQRRGYRELGDKGQWSPMAEWKVMII